MIFFPPILHQYIPNITGTHNTHAQNIMNAKYLLLVILAALLLNETMARFKARRMNSGSRRRRKAAKKAELKRKAEQRWKHKERQRAIKRRQQLKIAECLTSTPSDELYTLEKHGFPENNFLECHKLALTNPAATCTQTRMSTPTQITVNKCTGRKSVTQEMSYLQWSLKCAEGTVLELNCEKCPPGTYWDMFVKNCQPDFRNEPDERRRLWSSGGLQCPVEEDTSIRQLWGYWKHVKSMWLPYTLLVLMFGRAVC